MVVAGVEAWAAADLAPGAGAVVVGAEAEAVGQVVIGLRRSGVDAAGFVGDPKDPAAMEMAGELFPGWEVEDRRS